MMLARVCVCADARVYVAWCVVACSVLWHVHLQRPQHYLESCTKLLGYVGVIDHDPGYVSPMKVKKSAFADKIELLYRWERKFAYLPDAPQHCEVWQDMESFVMTSSTDEWLELAFEQESYLDGMECG